MCFIDQYTVFKYIIIFSTTSCKSTNYASVNIPAALSPHPRANHRTLAFFALAGKFPGVGTLEVSNPPGWERKKRANSPSSVDTATFFIDRTVEQCHFKHFNVRFLVSNNVFLCNSAILIETRRDDTSLWFSHYVIAAMLADGCWSTSIC